MTYKKSVEYNIRHNFSSAYYNYLKKNLYIPL